MKDGNNPCSQSEGLTLPYSKKRPRISDGNTQKPPGKKVAQSDSPRQEVKIKSKERFIASFRKVEFTPLHNAALKGHNEVVKTLLEKGASTDSKDKDGCTPLHDAALKGHNDVVKALLERGASTDSKDKDGCTPLHDAALEGHNDVVKTLLERSADVNFQNEDGRTPLHNAALEGHNEVVNTNSHY